MQQSPLVLWRFVLMLIRIRRSKDLLEQFQKFECSSLFAFNSCVYCTTRYNKCGRIGTKWLFFFTFIEECCVVMEKNIGKKLPNRISDQVWYKRWLKARLIGGPNLWRGGPNPLWQIRCDQVWYKRWLKERLVGGPNLRRGGPNPLWHRHPRDAKRYRWIYNLPHSDQISVPVLGRVVVTIVGVECLKKCPVMVKVGLSRFQKPIGELASVYHRWYARRLENSYNLTPVSRLLTTLCKITRPVRLGSRLGIGQ